MDMDSFLDSFGATDKPKKTSFKNAKFARVEEVQVTKAPYLGGDHKFVMLSKDGGFCREIWHLWEIYIKKGVHDEYDLPGYKFNLAETSAYHFNSPEEKKMIEDLHTYLEFLHHFINGGDLTYVDGKTYHFEAHPGFQAKNLPFSLYSDRRYTAVWWGKSIEYTAVSGEVTLNDGKVRLYRSTSSKALKALFKKIKIESGTSAASKDMSRMKSFIDLQLPSKPTTLTRCSYFLNTREEMGYDNQWGFVPQEVKVTSEDFESITSLDTVLANIEVIDMVEMGKWAEFFKGFCDRALEEYTPAESTVVKVRKDLESSAIVAPTSTSIEIPAEALEQMKASDVIAAAQVVQTPAEIEIEAITQGLLAKKAGGTLTKEDVNIAKAKIEEIKNPKVVETLVANVEPAPADPVVTTSVDASVTTSVDAVKTTSADPVKEPEVDELAAMWAGIE